MSQQGRILIFTMHKSASLFLHRVCADLARLTNRTYFSPNGGDVRVALKELAANADFWTHNTSGCFGPLRAYIEVPEMRQARILLHLRDPRDVLVSMFYSYCYSHVGEVAGGTGYRKEIADQGIDNFVLKLATAPRPPVTGDYGTGAPLWEFAGNVQQRYGNYVHHLLRNPQRDVVLVRYEDMLADLDGWLGSVAERFEVSDAALIEELADSYRPMFDRRDENKWVHTRKMTPGDYVEKLSPATITELDRIFENTLNCLGYSRADAQ